MVEEKLTLYRGLNLNIDDIKLIKKNGDVDPKMPFWILRPLVDHHNLSAKEIVAKWLEEMSGPYFERYAETDNSEMGKPVTGRKLGASIFAKDHNSKESYQVFEIQAKVDDVFIDGRDYLGGLIMRIARHEFIDSQVKNKLELIFGPKFISYIDELERIKSEDSDKLKGHSTDRLTDYICFDREVISEHYMNNSILIEGRYSTKFFSCFAILGGILPENIMSITGAYSIKDPENPTWWDFISRKTPTNDLNNSHPFDECINLPHLF